MAGTSGEISHRVRRVPKSKSSRATAAADTLPVVEAAAPPPTGAPIGLPAVSDSDVAALPFGALTNAIVTETIPVTASVLRLEAGLYAMKVSTAREGALEAGGSSSPVWVGPFAADGGFDALSATGQGEHWLRETETNLAVRVPKDGMLLLAAAFEAGDLAPSAPSVAAHPLGEAASHVEPDDTAPSVASLLMPEPAPQAEREIRTEISVHIERMGDRLFAGSTWAGTPGAQRRIEGFSIKPLQEIQPSEIEYKALHPGGIETPWVRGPQFCGTRGRSMPLTGLAIRIVPHVQDQFSVVYQATFFRSGITEPRGNGAPCLPKLPGDTLEGINVRIVQRRPG
jgi:hypothetical protein